MDGNRFWLDRARDDVKGVATVEVRAHLRRSRNLPRWRDALVLLSQNVEAQFTQRRAEFNAAHKACCAVPGGRDAYLVIKQEYEKWRAAALAFKRSINARLIEVRGLIREFEETRRLTQPPGRKKQIMWQVIAEAAELIADKHGDAGACWRERADAAGLNNWLANARGEQLDTSDQDED